MSQLHPLPEVLSVKQAADALHLSERAIRHRITAGRLQAIKLGPGTAPYVIPRSEVERIQKSAAA